MPDPKPEDRKLRETRLVVVMHSTDEVVNPLLVCTPLSRRTDLWRKYDYVLKKVNAPGLDDDSLVMTRLTQPILKKWLSKSPIAKVEPEAFGQIMAKYLWYLGLVEKV